MQTLKGKLLILFDFRTACYFGKPNAVLIMNIDEKNRISNLKKRSKH